MKLDKTEVKPPPTTKWRITKTGSVSETSQDGHRHHVPARRPVAICVLTAQNEDKLFRDDNAASILVGKIAKEVHDHFAKKAKQP